MYTLIIATDSLMQNVLIHIVDERNQIAHRASTVDSALSWLWLHDERQVVAMTDDGPELFLIESCSGRVLTLPSLSMRRAHLDRCCDPPKLPGLSPDPPVKTRLIEHDPETHEAKRRRR